MAARSLARHLPRLALATLVVGLGGTGSALGATTGPVPCERNPAFFDKTIDDRDLTVAPVDLSKSETVADFERAADQKRTSADASLAPLLYLAPRVESILDDVFDQESDAAETAEAVEESGQSVAPIADSSTPNADELSTEAQPLDVEPALLRIQREMYRTDI